VNDSLFNDLVDLGGDIITSERFDAAIDVPHHSKNGNIAAHSLETAGYALQIARWLNQHGKSINERDVVRASLLHDIGMTEEDIFLSPSSEKGRTHPVEGARIAREEFDANEVQVDAILHHMWPFCCLTPPHDAVGFVVTAADKMCSLVETRRRLKRSGDSSR
jgi:uncharacterized protein